MIIKATREIVSTTKKIAEEIKTVPSLKIVGRPDVSVVAFTRNLMDFYSMYLNQS